MALLGTNGAALYAVPNRVCGCNPVNSNFKQNDKWPGSALFFPGLDGLIRRLLLHMAQKMASKAAESD
jgi:hypothetical protein